MEALTMVVGVVIIMAVLAIRRRMKQAKREQVRGGVIILAPMPRVPFERLVKGYAWNIIGSALVWAIGTVIAKLYTAGDPMIAAMGLNEVPQNMLVLFGPWIGFMIVVCVNPFFPKGWLERPERPWNGGDLILALVLLAALFLHGAALWPVVVRGWSS